MELSKGLVRGTEMPVQENLKPFMADKVADTRQRDKDCTTARQRCASAGQELGRIIGRFCCVSYTTLGTPDMGT